MDKDTYSLQTNKDRGKRIQSCRYLTGFTAQEFARRHNIPLITLGKWERGNVTINEKVAHQCVQLFLAENLRTSLDWILYEKGEPPIVFNRNNPSFCPLATGDDQENIAPELALFTEVEFFKKNNKNAIVEIVRNKAMAPFLEIGDYVGGIILHKDFALGHRKICIVKLPNNKIVVRTFLLAKSKYVLAALNPSAANIITPLILETPPKFIAPIIFIRKVFNRSVQNLTMNSTNWIDNILDFFYEDQINFCNIKFPPR